MRMAIAIATSLLVACSAESEIAPRTPVNAQLVQHEKMRAPDIRDGFDQVALPSFAPSPPAPPRQTFSFGFIGDEPVGRYGPPLVPTWARPFPCHWTDTCWVAEPCLTPPARWGGPAP